MIGNSPKIEKGDPWTEQEDKILKLHYPDMTLGSLLKLLPYRTMGSIYNRAVRYLKLERSKDYQNYIKTVRTKKLKSLHKKNTKEIKSRTINNDIAYLYGVIVGDGSISQRRIYIATIDKDFILSLKNIYDEWTGLVSIVKRYKNTNGRYLWYVFFNSRKVVDFFRSLKINNFKTEEQKASFLRGLMDAEGNITVYKYKKKTKFNYGIRFDNTDKNLMLKAGRLFSDLGIKYTLNYYDRKRKMHFGRLPVYRIVISHHSLIPFYNKVGFGMSRKRDKLLNLVKEKYDLIGIKEK